MTPGSIGRQVANRIAPTTATTMMRSGDTRRRGVPPGGVFGGSPVGGSPAGGVPAGAASGDGAASDVWSAACDEDSGGEPVGPPSDAPRGVGVRTVGLSSAMSPTVYGRRPRGPSAASPPMHWCCIRATSPRTPRPQVTARRKGCTLTRTVKGVAPGIAEARRGQRSPPTRPTPARHRPRIRPTGAIRSSSAPAASR